jgi:hypothetical protein
MSAAVIAAFLPALDVFIAGDDFEWLDASYDIVADPLSSFQLINHFFRPLVKWTYLANYLIFGTAGVGYMITNLLIHLLNTVLLALLLRRRLHRPLLGFIAAAAFALSPLHSEAVFWAAGRPDTLLLTCWLFALLLLEGWTDGATFGMVAAFTGVALLGAGAKESWIVFPFLASAYLVLVMRQPIAAVLRKLAVLWMAWSLYIVVFLVRPLLSGAPSPTGYADFQVVPGLLKTAFTLLGFCGLGWLPIKGLAMPIAVAFLVGGAAAWLVRENHRFGVWAMLWLAATLALVAPFSPSALRHNYLPLVGFWMVVAALCDGALAAVSDDARTWRWRVAITLVAVTAAAVIALEGFALQREIDDYRLYGDLHLRLCRSFAEIDPAIARDRPLVLVDKGTLRGVDYVADHLKGREKTFFVRRDALWQLVFLPPLANFLGRPFDERLQAWVKGHGTLSAGGFTVVLFDDYGFHLRPDLASAVEEAVAANEGLPVGISLYRFSDR